MGFAISVSGRLVEVDILELSEVSMSWCLYCHDSIGLGMRKTEDFRPEADTGTDWEAINSTW